MQVIFQHYNSRRCCIFLAQITGNDISLLEGALEVLQLRLELQN